MLGRVMKAYPFVMRLPSFVEKVRVQHSRHRREDLPRAQPGSKMVVEKCLKPQVRRAGSAPLPARSPKLRLSKL